MVTMMTLRIQCGLIKIEARIAFVSFLLPIGNRLWSANFTFVCDYIELLRDAEAQDVPDARSD